MPDLEFEHIGKYKILAKIGQGAMGEVFRAHDPVLDREVAIKTIAAGPDSDDTLRKRFEREAQSAARLNHPNVITVYDFGDEHGRMYMAMELLEGRDLKELISRRGLPDLRAKLDVMEQMCDGLAYAHGKGVVHRDLKPGNIHVQPSGQVKIMDFGLARLGASDMTREGMILGTPNYMSPEQVRGEKADTRSDIFALGAVFYELLSNRKPFDADSLHAVLFNVLQQQPEPVRHWVPELPPSLVELVEKALSKDPAERFPHAGEMRDALRAVRQSLAEGGVAESTVAMEPESPLAHLADAPPPAPPPASRSASTGASSMGRAAVAVDLSRSDTLGREDSGSRPGRKTLSGSATTARDGLGPAGIAAPKPAGSPSSRGLLYAGGGLGAVALVVAAALLVGRRPEPSASPAPDGQVTALTQALVASRVDLARRALEDKDFRGAVAQAEGVLELDPRSDPARAILEDARRSLEEVEASAAQARSAFEAGDADGASRAVARLMELDPRHPVAAELSQKLGSRLRAEAEEARRAMRRARASAEGASAQAVDDFDEAAARGGEGEALLRRSEFGSAAQRFLAARDGFDRARREALERARAAPPVSAPATVPPPTVPVTLAPTAPPPTVPAPTPPPATAPAGPPATVPPATVAPANDEPAIRRVVADYGRAIETKDLGLFRTLKPNLSSDEERRLEEAFRAIQSHRVEIRVASLRIDGSRATVKVSRRDVVDGRPVPAQRQTLVLVKGPSGWRIDEIGR